MAGYLAGIAGTVGTQTVVIIHNEGLQDETRVTAEAFIRPKMGTFEVETPVYEGDVVEMDDPRGGRMRRLVAQVRAEAP
jgi:hypothetical protein